MTPKFDVPEPGRNQRHTWVVLDDMAICFTTAGDISDDVWTRFTNDVRPKNIKAILGLSYETAVPSSTQRKQTASAIDGKMLSAVLQSTVTRGVLTALGWLGLNLRVKAYSWKELDLAIERTAPSLESAKIARKLVEELLERSGGRSLASLIK